MLYSVYAVLGVGCTHCMLCSLYTVLSVNSCSWHREIVWDDFTLYFAIMVELWTREREMKAEDENDVEDTWGIEKSGLHHAGVGWEDLVRSNYTPDPALYLPDWGP